MEINWKLNGNSSIPMYRQIVNYIKDKILKGHWTIGNKLPMHSYAFLKELEWGLKRLSQLIRRYN